MAVTQNYTLQRIRVVIEGGAKTALYKWEGSLLPLYFSRPMYDGEPKPVLPAASP
jgi:hypothetical protein